MSKTKKIKSAKVIGESVHIEYEKDTPERLDTLTGHDDGVSFDGPKLTDMLNTFDGNYIIVKHGSDVGLCFEVDGMIKRGFKPLGGIAIYYDHKAGHLCYVQAMVKA